MTPPPSKIGFPIAALCAVFFVLNLVAGMAAIRSMSWIEVLVDPVTTTVRYIDNVGESEASDAERIRLANVAALDLERLLESEGEVSLAWAIARRRSLVLAESGDLAGALDAAPDEDSSEWLGAFYRGEDPTPLGADEFSALPAEVDLLLEPQGWLSQRVEARLDGRDPDASKAEGSSSELYLIIQRVLYGMAALVLILSTGTRRALFGRGRGPGGHLESLDLALDPCMRAFFVAAAIGAVGVWVQMGLHPYSLTGMFGVPLMGLVAVVALGHSFVWAPLGSRHPLAPPRPTVPVALGMTIVVLALDLGAGSAFGSLPWPDHFLPHWAEGVDDRMFQPEWSIRLACLLDTMVWAPLNEECLFRGILFLGLRQRFGFVGAGTVSSLIFSAGHGYSPYYALQVTFGGLFLAYLVERSGSLWPGILAHAGYNTVALVAIQAEFG